MPVKMSSYSGNFLMFDIKQVTLEPICDSVPSLTYILDVVKYCIPSDKSDFCVSISKCYSIVEPVVVIHCVSCP